MVALDYGPVLTEVVLTPDDLDLISRASPLACPRPVWPPRAAETLVVLGLYEARTKLIERAEIQNRRAAARRA